MWKYIKNQIETELYDELRSTYSDAEFENIWGSLLSAGNLFRKIATTVAAIHGYSYPDTEAMKVSAFIRKIRTLPDDATDV